MGFARGGRDDVSDSLSVPPGETPMKCDNCGQTAVAFYGERRRTENGTNLVSTKHYCYECYCEKNEIKEELNVTI
jgi:hypothetical protein